MSPALNEVTTMLLNCAFYFPTIVCGYSNNKHKPVKTLARLDSQQYGYFSSGNLTIGKSHNRMLSLYLMDFSETKNGYIKERIRIQQER